MFKFKKKETFQSIGTGKLVPLESVSDQMFSKKLLGDGFAINLSIGEVYAPFSGELTVAFPTGHAFGLKNKQGHEVLIHIGIDTVELDGEGFTSFVKQGDTVKQGQLLAKVNLDSLVKAGKDPVTMVVFTNGETIEINNLHQEVTPDTTDFLTIQ